MINRVQHNEVINTDADANIKGIGLQKIRAVERLLSGLLENKTAIMCTIEHKDDVFQLDISNDKPKYTTEQNKSYESTFSLNSKEVKNSLRIFFDNWYRTIEGSEEIKFVFYTNTTIMKEKKVGALQEKDLNLPDKPVLQMLIEKNYSEALPYVKAVFEDYYIKQHKKHTQDISVYENILRGMEDDHWICFLKLIEWNFGKADEQEVRKNVVEKVVSLCSNFGVDKKHANSIVAELLDMVESRTFEKDFLKRIVHIGEVKSLFLEKATIAKVRETLDPIHSKWDEIECADMRNMRDKIEFVCPEFDQDELDYYKEEYADGVYEQKNHNNIRAVKAFNYRVFKVCKREIKKYIKENKGHYSQEQIIEFLNYLTQTAEELIRDKAQSYDVAYKDKDMIKKTILILFEECFLSFDGRGEING